MTGAEIIFIVDDESPICKTLAELLRLHGISAVPFTNPLEALSAAQALAPDLLISDYLMPQMDGLTLAREVAKCAPVCKVLIFSSALSTLDGQAGCEHFELLHKPAPAKDLIAKIRQMLDHQETQRTVA